MSRPLAEISPTAAPLSSTTTLAGSELAHKLEPDQQQNVKLSSEQALPPSRPSSFAAPQPQALPSNLRRYTLLTIFCASQFFDIFSGSAVIIAISRISEDLGLTSGESTWIINAYTLTLAAFLLAAGRVADIYSAKWTFVGGLAWVGLFSLGVGLSKDKITVIVLRAFSGIGAAATIPAALNLIGALFPDEREQARAIAIFSGVGALANILGLVIGAILLLASWNWILYFVAIVTIPCAIASAFLIPAHARTTEAAHVELEKADEHAAAAASAVVVERQPRMDYLGLLLLTAAIVLLVFGVSNGNSQGWRHAQTIAPIVIGAALFPAFFFWQTRMPAIDALIDPATWRIKNFALLAICGLFPNYWWYLVQSAYSELFQRDWHTSAIMTGVHFLPLSLAGGSIVFLNGYLPRRFTLKWRIIVGSSGCVIGTILLIFADAERWYWPLMFPGFIIGSGSLAMAWVTCYIALMLSVPQKHKGVAGGVFNSAGQLGCSVFLSIATAIQVGDLTPAGHPAWTGYRNSFIFGAVAVAVIPVLTFFFFQDPLEAPVEGSAGEDVVRHGEEAQAVNNNALSSEA